MLSIPLTPTFSQRLTCTLSGQVCRIDVYQKLFGVFVDLYVDDALIIGGVLGLNVNRIVRSAYLGFDGDLSFFDTQGAGDPDWTGLGSRYLLLYLTEAELAALGVG